MAVALRSKSRFPGSGEMVYLPCRSVSASFHGARRQDPEQSRILVGHLTRVSSVLLASPSCFSLLGPAIRGPHHADASGGGRVPCARVPRGARGLEQRDPGGQEGRAEASLP